MTFSPGDSVDLYDRLFQQWRGAYVVAPQKTDTGLIKIRNTKTGSQQFVRAERLRKGRLAPFFIKTLKP
jgi:hypothetical protein